MRKHFSLGYLFLKNYGLLEMSQEEIGEHIDRSTSTVNILFKELNKEDLVIKIDRGYHLADMKKFFEYWRQTLSELKVETEYARFNSELSRDEVKGIMNRMVPDDKWALSGPRIESLLDDNLLTNQKDFTVFVENRMDESVIKELKLMHCSDGEVTLCRGGIDLRDIGQIAHEIVICADLMNSSVYEIRRAGQSRFSKYLDQAREVIVERFGHPYFLG